MSFIERSTSEVERGLEEARSIIVLLILQNFRREEIWEFDVKKFSRTALAFVLDYLAEAGKSKGWRFNQEEVRKLFTFDEKHPFGCCELDKVLREHRMIVSCISINGVAQATLTPDCLRHIRAELERLNLTPDENKLLKDVARQAVYVYQHEIS